MDRTTKSNEKTAKTEKNANILFTAVIILIGVLLFLLTDTGAKFLDSMGITASVNKTEDEVLVTKDYNDGNVLMSVNAEKLIKQISSEWPNSKYKSGYSDAGKAEYTVYSEALSVDVDFTYSDGNCSNISITYSVVEAPDEHGIDLTPIESYIAKKEDAAYEAYCTDVRVMLNSLLTALNGGSAKGIDTTLNMLHSAVLTAEESGKVNSFEGMELDFKVYTTGSKAEKTVVVNIE